MEKSQIFHVWSSLCIIKLNLKNNKVTLTE